MQTGQPSQTALGAAVLLPVAVRSGVRGSRDRPAMTVHSARAVATVNREAPEVGVGRGDCYYRRRRNSFGNLRHPQPRGTT